MSLFLLINRAKKIKEIIPIEKCVLSAVKFQEGKIIWVHHLKSIPEVLPGSHAGRYLARGDVL